MVNNIINNSSIIWDKYVVSYEGLATLLTILVITLKLLINRKVTILHFKKTVVSVPSEITFLVIGFLLSTMVSDNCKEIQDIKDIMGIILISFLIIIAQYALERSLDNKLSGKIKIKCLACIISMYIVSVTLYCVVVFGGKF